MTADDFAVRCLQYWEGKSDSAPSIYAVAPPFQDRARRWLRENIGDVSVEGFRRLNDRLRAEHSDSGEGE